MTVELRRAFGNPALLLGLLGVLALLTLGVFGATLAPQDPNAGTSLVMRDLPNGNTTFLVPPTLPDAQHLFGTDALGRDQWSRILAGARLTLMVVLGAAVVRLLIGFVVGIATGWYGGRVARGVRSIASGVNAIPQLMLAIMLVEVTRRFGVIGFIGSLALVGWPEIVEFLHAEVARVKVQPFIEAATGVGAPGRTLIRRHVLTILGPQLLTLAALETGAVLLLLAELGLVGLFLAGTTFLVDDFGIIGTLKERAPEWGQMLGSIQFYAMSQQQLSTLIPAVFIVLAATAFTLLADGLRAASDPFSPNVLLPRTFGVLSQALAACVCVSAIGFVALNARPTALSMEDGRAIAAKTAETTWPGSEFVAGVARFSAAAHGLDRPERLTYYYRNDRNEVLKITFQNADPLAVEVRKYETEDEIDFASLKPLPEDLMSYDQPIAKAEETLGAAFRKTSPSYLVRAILTWPKDRDGPVYEVTYGQVRGQLTTRRACCYDAKSGETLDAVLTARATPPWPVPPGCAASRTVVQPFGQQAANGPVARFVTGALSVGSFENFFYQGDNFVVFVGGQGVPTLERASLAGNASAKATLVDAQANGAQSFGALQLPEPGCWTMRMTAGSASLDLTVYVYPWDCRHDPGAVPGPEITPRPCTPP